ncbi:hypothetical protein J2S43_001367 [Catenuloplanes nepalensis]|uniref:Arsenate reductase n=1 Tax=Catenuloplanes nepalensis TaxID=587533 RepID=A0ABT9MN53_9ACTN|nr:hypothetical protein [Catenuloplanes nepalensis]MDP9792855.1 hypothetical protein [Catenuloplanes nepalensis]
MTAMGDPAWVPEACTLPTADRPLRLAEFDDLFTAALRGQSRASATTLHWDLDPATETKVRDLACRETGCCSFFAFTIRPGAGSLRVAVRVPAAHVAVLDALERRATDRMRS